jgi:hypothetical protein
MQMAATFPQSIVADGAMNEGSWLCGIFTCPTVSSSEPVDTGVRHQFESSESLAASDVFQGTSMTLTLDG